MKNINEGRYIINFWGRSNRVKNGDWDFNGRIRYWSDGDIYLGITFTPDWINSSSFGDLYQKIKSVILRKPVPQDTMFVNIDNFVKPYKKPTFIEINCK